MSVALLVIAAAVTGATTPLVSAARSLEAPAGDASAPDEIRAVYISYYGVADSTTRSRIFDLLDRTDLNAVVIDVKGDRGFISYATSVELAVQAGARGPIRWGGFDAMLQQLKARGVYTIARIVVFKDDVLAR